MSVLEDFLDINPVEEHSISGRFNIDAFENKEVQDEIIETIIQTNIEHTNPYTYWVLWLKLISITAVSSNEVIVCVENSKLRSSNDSSAVANSYADDLKKHIKNKDIEILVKDIHKERIEFSFIYPNSIIEEIVDYEYESEIDYNEDGFEYDILIRFKEEQRKEKLDELSTLKDIKGFYFNACNEDYFPFKNGYVSMGLNVFSDKKEERLQKVQDLLMNLKGFDICIK